MSIAADYEGEDAAILAGIDLVAEYRAMGLEFVESNPAPNANGFAPAWSAAKGGKAGQRTPSAVVNLRTGQYMDSASGELAISLWEFSSRFTGQSFQAARRHFAAKAGVTLGGGRPKKRPSEQLEFIPWDNDVAAAWCSTKPPVTIDALQLNGAQLAKYPKRKPEFTVIALPVFGPNLVAAKPVNWVLYNADGGKLPSKNKEGEITGWVKIKTISTGHGGEPGMIGQFALMRLHPEIPCSTVVKTEGPSCMLALFSIIPPEERESWLVCCNAYGAGEDPTHYLHHFRGKRVAVVHDADDGGNAGRQRWVDGLLPVAESVRAMNLPFELRRKDGLDLRDWINKRES